MRTFSYSRLNEVVEQICKLLNEFEPETGFEHDHYAIAVRIAIRRYMSAYEREKDEVKDSDSGQ